MVTTVKDFEKVLKEVHQMKVNFEKLESFILEKVNAAKSETESEEINANVKRAELIAKAKEFKNNFEMIPLFDTDYKFDGSTTKCIVKGIFGGETISEGEYTLGENQVSNFEIATAAALADATGDPMEILEELINAVQPTFAVGQYVMCNESEEVKPYQIAKIKDDYIFDEDGTFLFKKDTRILEDTHAEY